MPGVFVFLWSTGFIGAKLGLPHAPPLTFLTLRYALVAALLVGVAVVARAPWPRSAVEARHYAVAGLLVHGLYLGGVFVGISLGVEAGVSALIVGVQPLLVAAFAGVALGERVTGRQWLGLALGLLGVAMILARKLGLVRDIDEKLHLLSMGDEYDLSTRRPKNNPAEVIEEQLVGHA